MTTAREIINPGADCVRTDQTAADAATLMTRLGVGALPICGKDDKLKGVVTDRDLVVKVLGPGRDPATFPAGSLNQQEAVTIGADDSAQVRLCSDTQAVGLPACVAREGTEGGSGMATKKQAG